jgi:hypothetical protein
LPWFETSGGDVGSRAKIDPIKRAGVDFAQYLVIANDIVSPNFDSIKKWVVESYDPPPLPGGTVPESGSGFYDTLFRKFSRQCPPSASLSGSTQGELAAKATDPACNTFVRSGDYNPAVDWSNGDYSGNPAVIFITGSMTIDRSVRIARNHGVVFVSKGDIRINTNSSNRLDGVYLTDSVFNSSNLACGSPFTNSDTQLRVRGSLYSFDRLCLTRSLANNNLPAEIFNYAPEYLWLFREMLGESRSTFTEVNP